MTDLIGHRRTARTARAVLSLVLLLGLGVLVNQLLPKETSAEAELLRTVLSVGVLMIGAWVSGLLCEQVQLPAITGYLVFGMLVGPSVAGLLGYAPLVPAEHIRGKTAPLRLASDLAIALIALTAGGEIHLAWLRGKVKRVVLVLGLHMLILMLAVGGAVLLVSPWIPFLAGESATTLAVVALLCAVVMVAKSPAVTIAMISNYRAAGPLSQMTLVITVFKDLVLIVLFAATMAVGRGMLQEQAEISADFLFRVGLELVGSVVVGAVMGLAMAWYVEKVRAHLPIFVIGSCLLIALMGEQHLHVAAAGFSFDFELEPLLMALSAGLLMNNVWRRSSEPLFKAMESTELPVFCLFFALAGAKIDLVVFADLWMWSLGLVVVRAIST
ncbi:MAG: cation:proton antiporter, partial [Phycisphaerae bacterium]|nr:cation:proton antiporter [Phycisphaerae bacterium]